MKIQKPKLKDEVKKLEALSKARKAVSDYCKYWYDRAIEAGVTEAEAATLFPVGYQKQLEKK